jgi:sRNA-binding protein
MTDIPTDLPELPELDSTPAPSDAQSASQAAALSPAPTSPTPAKGKGRFAAAQPVLEKLFELYPQLFGQRFLPLKLGVFQDLMALHPDVFKRDDLKLALGVHTRSTRYLQSVASGAARHDLQCKAIEAVAPEHVLLSIVELYTRRQARTQEDMKPRLQSQLLAAYQASGLTRQDYLSRLPTLPESVASLLDEVIAQADQQRARAAALLKAFDASGKSVAVFAAEWGMEPEQVQAVLNQRKPE